MARLTASQELKKLVLVLARVHPTVLVYTVYMFKGEVHHCPTHTTNTMKEEKSKSVPVCRGSQETKTKKKLVAGYTHGSTMHFS